MYGNSLSNLDKVTLDTDGIFSDGYDQQLPKFTGDVTSGYTTSINVPIDSTTAQNQSMPGGGMGGPGAGGTPPSGMMPPQ